MHRLADVPAQFSFNPRFNKPLRLFGRKSSSEVLTDPGSAAAVSAGAAVSAAIAVAAVHAFVAIAGFVAGAAVPPAALLLHSRSVALSADVPDPAAAGVSAAPVLASRIPSPVVAGTFDPALGYLCLEGWVARRAEG